jgi:DNA invertase Pin-like site-specific DNA recombinase
MFREAASGAQTVQAELRKMLARLDATEVIIIPTSDRLYRDATDLLVIARDIRRAGAGLRSITDPVADTMSGFAELDLIMLGGAAKLERRRMMERTARGRRMPKAMT